MGRAPYARVKVGPRRNTGSGRASQLGNEGGAGRRTLAQAPCRPSPSAHQPAHAARSRYAALHAPHVTNLPWAAFGRPAALLSSIPLQKDSEETVRRKPSRLASRRELMQRAFKDFIKTDFIGKLALSALILSFAAVPAAAQKKYDPGVTDTEIKIGNIMPYSGPASAYSVTGRTEAAYFRKINAEGGINGRKINFISYDDAYSPPKAVEQARRLVEGNEVFLIFGSTGTPSNTAIQKYLNAKKVPQLFVQTGATKWNDPQNFPWTMGWSPNYQNEARIYARYILKEKPDAKIAVLYQNDDYGKDYLKGLKDGLGAKAASMIVAEDAYEVAEPTIDSHVVKMKSLNADVFVDITTAKFAAQAIRKAAEIGWKPLHFLNNVSTSIGAVIGPGGVEEARERVLV